MLANWTDEGCRMNKFWRWIKSLFQHDRPIPCPKKDCKFYGELCGKSNDIRKLYFYPYCFLYAKYEDDTRQYD